MIAKADHVIVRILVATRAALVSRSDERSWRSGLSRVPGAGWPAARLLFAWSRCGAWGRSLFSRRFGRSTASIRRTHFDLASP